MGDVVEETALAKSPSTAEMEWGQVDIRFEAGCMDSDFDGIRFGTAEWEPEVAVKDNMALRRSKRSWRILPTAAVVDRDWVGIVLWGERLGY